MKKPVLQARRRGHAKTQSEVRIIHRRKQRRRGHRCVAVNLFTLMNSALGPLIRRLGLVPNRRVNRPKKTPATRPASIGETRRKAEDRTSNRRSTTGGAEMMESVLLDFEEAINPYVRAVDARRVCCCLANGTIDRYRTMRTLVVVCS